MASVLSQIERLVAEAIARACPDAEGAPALVTPAQDEKFGDYQANCAMPLAKKLKLPPREIAQTIADSIDAPDMLEEAEIAGPGFINLRLRPQWVAARARESFDAEHLGVEPAREPETIVIDYSSPNVAKTMHVGHIRSTIIGDAIARMLRFLGHNVITDNHIGDWGTQFGLLIVGYRSGARAEALEEDPVAELARLYTEAAKRAEADESVRDAARAELAKLQAGDEDNRRLWQQFTDWSRAEFARVYARLGVKFDHTLGESFYHGMLPAVVEELKKKGLAEKSEGAWIVRLEAEGLSPFMVQKTDGAFLYATTDLATIKYRHDRLHADRIIYVTDARQQLHFRQLFATARRWGYEMKLEHVWFGSILGPDGKPFKTRAGGVVRLEDLLDEAEQRAMAIVDDKNPDLPKGRRETVARAVGIGAIKYGDLSQNRQSDFVFSWDTMLAMTGNTAPYLQYAYARIMSIFRKGGLSEEDLRHGSATVPVEHAAEARLAKMLLQFPDALDRAASEYKPNLLASYLYSLATAFMAFYDNCPVLKSDSPIREGRLMFCDFTARVLQTGLGLLGIETLEEM
ncbi:MAG: arginine--tRNA ligase [Planctomycetia bacterium]|nr:arginine--tRNA ligase [Planctomycetia bacterium]